MLFIYKVNKALENICQLKNMVEKYQSFIIVEKRKKKDEKCMSYKN